MAVTDELDVASLSRPRARDTDPYCEAERRAILRSADEAGVRECEQDGLGK